MRIARMRRHDIILIMRIIARTKPPHGRLDYKHNQSWAIVTACRAGTEELVTIETTLEQWLDLLPVQYVVKTALSRQQPRRPIPVSNDDASSLVPRAHIEWREGQNWVVLTAHLLESRDAVTVDIPLHEWFCLIPVRHAVEDRLERWQENKLRQLGEL
jgi:hypothetical protein